MSLLRKSLLRTARPLIKGGHEQHFYIYEKGFVRPRYMALWIYGFFTFVPFFVVQSAWYFYCAPGIESWEPMEYPNAEEMKKREHNPLLL
eukprot:CAMPEP_0117440346 /NCGR_PEP_ID=MMETSP0759-20121206/3041_1 /TAXON_ID=63605 /ORGANISM="Percolomonas cosmopolitus, Strain WS" /LENGTH=89 /DNA_ID=CAMNT_0005232105 /DNA_START=187 /DNA_END=456 /DNA_ORIENTATION=-